MFVRYILHYLSSETGDYCYERFDYVNDAKERQEKIPVRNRIGIFQLID